MTDDITIYHNPNCGTSRNVLAMIRSTGAQPRIVEYLKTPPPKDELKRLIAAMGMGSAREVLRRKGTPYDELHLDEPHWTDDQLLDLIAQHPILLQRPIVVTGKGTRMCRPSEVVLDILPQPMQQDFVKEDGEVVKAQGRR